jgi:periplasmic copper chaperone A
MTHQHHESSVIHMRKSLIAAGVAAAILTDSAVASAHVTANPREAPAGVFTVLNVRVPHELRDKGTVKIDLCLPDGVYFVSYKKS